MVEWWRGSLGVGGIELVEKVLSKLAPPEGMTQQQELTRARRVKLSTHNQTLKLFKPAHLFQRIFLDPNCSMLFNMSMGAASGLPRAVVVSSRVGLRQQQQEEESEGRLWRAEQELACRATAPRKCCAQN